MLLKILKLYMPESIKNKKLDDLFRITADAFQCKAPDLKGLAFAERLHAYAVFTQEQAEAYLQSEESLGDRKRGSDAVEERLYQNSFLLGEDLRKSLRVKNRKQAIEALELIYRIIGIDFHAGRAVGTEHDRAVGTEHNRAAGPESGGPAGYDNCGHAGSDNCGPNEFTVKECYFSSYYYAEICELISSLDEGLAAGLTGGGRLAFTERITEGCGCCKGVLL